MRSPGAENKDLFTCAVHSLLSWALSDTSGSPSPSNLLRKGLHSQFAQRTGTRQPRYLNPSRHYNGELANIVVRERFPSSPDRHSQHHY